MNIIDQYITDHYNEPLDEIAIELGTSISYVMKRKIKLTEKPVITESIVIPSGVNNEMAALINLITLRKIGWAVGIAKERLKKLQYLERM